VNARLRALECRVDELERELEGERRKRTKH